MVRSPYRFSHSESERRGPTANQGEHNRDVLAEWLGLDDDEIALLIRSGVLVTEEPLT